MALKQKTIYFREEDLDKWALIKNKAEWLHVMLNNSWRGKPIKDMPELFEPYEGLHTTTTKPTGVLTEKFLKEQFKKAEKASNLCEHFQLKGQCMVKSCKYGRGKKWVR